MLKPNDYQGTQQERLPLIKNFKLTTECSYRWRWDQMHYWKYFYKPRLLNEIWVQGVRVKVPAVGVAFGPVMFFWKWE